MKNVKFALLTAVVIAAMTACGQSNEVPAVQEEEPQAVADTVKYMFKGKEVSAQELDALEAKHGKLFLLDQGGRWEVYTNEADLKAAQDNTLNALACVGRNRTTIYDYINYGGASLKISKGSGLSDLRTVSQGSSSNWDNDISSFKGACGAYTYFYTGYNFSGNVFVTKGQMSSDLGGWSTVISSLRVSN